MLDEYRNVIDNIDEMIIKLFCKRLEVVDLIKDIKDSNSLDIEDLDREKNILDRVDSIADEEYREDCKQLYNTIFNISKNRQK